MRVVLCAVAGAMILAASAVRAQVRDRNLRWRTITTESFELNYPEPLEELARRTAAVLEETHRRLVPLLGHRPRGRVRVVLTDGSDSANGSATALPFNTMRLYATAPDDLSVLSDYDDWLTTLVVHEHTHILQLDNIGGLPAIINHIFGKIYAPNMVQPRFITEGMAVYFESRETAGGRMRGTQFEMYMRMAALEDRLLRLDQVANGVDRWPHGNVYYLYGSRFIAFVASRYGDGALRELATIYGRQPIPYGVNRVALRSTGKSVIELYAEWQAHERAKQADVLREVEAGGRVEGERLTHTGEYVRYPRFVDETHVVYFVNDGHSDPQLRIADARAGGSPREVVRANAFAYPSVHPDGSIYYGSPSFLRDIYYQYELYRVDPRTGRRRRLTRGLRAREPDVSPDGARVTFTVNSGGTTHLAIADTQDIEGTVRLLVRDAPSDQVFTPRFSPDGRTIAVSTWSRGGYRDIQLVDAETGARRQVTLDRALDTGPTWSPDGRYLYFSSDRTGIANIYRWEVTTGDLRQVTNVIGGAYCPVVAPDGERLLYVGYTSFGFDLYGLDLPRDGAPPLPPAPPYHDERPPPSEATRTVEGPTTRYYPIETLLPRHWFFDYRTDGYGRNLGVTVRGADVVGFYSWSAWAGVSLEKGFVSASAAFQFLRMASPLALTGYRVFAPRGGFVSAGVPRSWDAQVEGARIAVSHAFLRQFSSNTVGGSYGVQHVSPADGLPIVLDPNDPPPVLPPLGWKSDAQLGWTYTNARRRTYDMTPSAGRVVHLALSVLDPVGQQTNHPNMRLAWSWKRYLEAPWIHHHVFAIRYAGGVSAGPPGSRGYFFLGGFPQFSVVNDLIDGVVRSGVGLRGYPQYVAGGTQYHLVQGEYRVPLVRMMAGVETLPFFVKRAYASVFVDWGNAFVGPPDPRDFRVAAGCEIFVDFSVGYFLSFTWRTGFAYGFDAGGGPRFYSNIGVPF